MRTLVALMLVLPPLAAQAQTVRGAGARPCADWTQARRSGGRDFEAEQWTLGYMSAVNAATKGGLLRAADEKEAFAAMDAYCAGHATDMLWNAIRSALTRSHGS